MPPRPGRKTTIAVLSPRPETARLLLRHLDSARGRGEAPPAVAVYTAAPEFIAAVLRRAPDAAVIDMECRGISGRDLILVMRRSSAASAALIAAFSHGAKPPREIASGLETGADEYFTLPRDLELIGPRIANMLAARRARSGAETVEPAPVKIGNMEVSPASRSAVLNGRELPLTSLEFDMLLYFLNNAGRVVGRGALIQQVWKTDLGVNLRSVDKRIEVLRKKLKGAGVTISTVFGLGYIFR